jgi:tRNA pseudouridine32 synthase/23S rRNA pseudouridine746 synthase/23S rRNA pseudouridine1911/1915/1917 synthase
VVKEEKNKSLLKINLLTGKKNQIRVHMAEAGHPIIGDTKYGKKNDGKTLMLHSFSIEFNHPFSRKRIEVSAKVPDYFGRLMDFKY